jgi:hypothetical protein
MTKFRQWLITLPDLSNKRIHKRDNGEGVVETTPFLLSAAYFDVAPIVLPDKS